jgi:hypothetical protein
MKAAHKRKALSRLLRLRGAWAVLPAAFAVVCLLLWFGLTPSQAQTAPPPPLGCCAAAPAVGSGTCVDPETCEAPGTSSQVSQYLISDFYSALQAGAYAEEAWLFKYVGEIMTSAYDQLDWLQDEMIDFWNTMWYYNFLPGLQGMTREIKIGLAQQVMQKGSNADASSLLTIARALNKHEIEDRVDPGEQVCVAATSAGGFTRSVGFSRLMRQAWEYDSLASGLNTTTDSKGAPYPGAHSAIGSYQQMYKNYHDIFCDPNGNGGNNNCGASTTLKPSLYNADVQPIKYIYNSLTIPVDVADNPAQGPMVEKAINDIISNMVGLPAADPMLASALVTPQGRQAYLSRRSYVARYAAIRSVPDIVASWRMPGSQMGAFVDDLRENAGVDIQRVSRNPSYKEIMHAVSVDRFESGRYAANMLTDSNKVEMEKLNLSVFYLMQLRDYYELLERTALALAVQVSILSEQQIQALPDIYSTAPLK